MALDAWYGQLQGSVGKDLELIRVAARYVLIPLGMIWMVGRVLQPKHEPETDW